jgi:hypothetical protein
MGKRISYYYFWLVYQILHVFPNTQIQEARSSDVGGQYRPHGWPTDQGGNDKDTLFSNVCIGAEGSNFEYFV